MTSISMYAASAPAFARMLSNMLTWLEAAKAHAEARGTTLVHWATAWVLNNRAVTSAIAGPRTLEQWTSYLGALDYAWTAEDEAFADSLVTPGHPSTPNAPPVQDKNNSSNCAYRSGRAWG